MQKESFFKFLNNTTVAINKRKLTNSECVENSVCIRPGVHEEHDGILCFSITNIQTWRQV